MGFVLTTIDMKGILVPTPGSIYETELSTRQNNSRNRFIETEDGNGDIKFGVIKQGNQHLVATVNTPSCKKILPPYVQTTSHWNTLLALL
ncbi:unnamed protein product [Citrullus colocynthis]|uniref:Uncharacterized protein n=1 Tax=Citrullus colocynthis TaxID=252529 RepID=A0ABP0Z8H4_9ROSI